MEDARDGLSPERQEPSGNCCLVYCTSLGLLLALVAVVSLTTALAVYAPRYTFQRISKYSLGSCFEENKTCELLAQGRVAYNECTTPSLLEEVSVSLEC